ncbi:MAG: hypothetical protein ABJH63_18810 [Rhizobiaceae bacterium]
MSTPQFETKNIDTIISVSMKEHFQTNLRPFTNNKFMSSLLIGTNSDFPFVRQSSEPTDPIGESYINIIADAVYAAADQFNIDHRVCGEFLRLQNYLPAIGLTSLSQQWVSLEVRIKLSDLFEMGGVPLLAGLEGSSDNAPRTLFDFTSPRAVEILHRHSPAFRLPTEDEPITRGFWSRLRKAMLSSRLVEIVQNEDSARFWISAHLAADLELQLLSFVQSNRSPNSLTKVRFTLETRGDQLIVDSFPQARYRPIQFGRSKFAVGMLQPGYYGFQTSSQGSPPPKIDPSVHSVSQQNKHGFTTSF